MIYLIVVFVGALMGAVFLLASGVPVVLLRFWQYLPLDRRMWWTLAALFAARCVHHVAIGENGYVVPIGGEQLASYNAFRLGGFACIGLLWLIGIITLFWLGSSNSSEPVAKIAWPAAAVVMLFGLVLSLDRSELRLQQIADRRAAVVAALKSSDIPKLKQLMADGEKLHQPLEELGNFEPFRYAIKQQDIPMIRFFMNRPESDRPDMYVWKSSMLASGNREIIDILFDSTGRDPVSLGRSINVAVHTDAREAFNYAISLGGDPNHVYNYTALMIASQRNMLGYAEALLAAGAKVNMTHQSDWGKTNRTALSFAAEKGHIEMIRLLLEHNADPTIADEHDKLPIDWARAHFQDAVVELLAKISETPQRQEARS